MDRIELALVEQPDRAGGPARRGETGASLLVAANVNLPSDDATTRGEVEQDLGAQVGERYARQGIPAAAYDLQLVWLGDSSA